jgi:3-dehydroquinate synthase
MAALILRYGPIPPFKIAASPHAAAQKLVALTSADKKVRSGRRAFVLTTGIGSTAIAHDVTDPELLTATRAMFTTMRSAASEPTSSDP